MASERTEPESPDRRRITFRQALGRGARGRCPNCARRTLFRRYLKPADACSHCAARFGHIRADDAPPYLTLFISGHIVIPAALWHLQLSHPPTWVLFAVWMPVLLASVFALLPVTKGAVLGIMWQQGLSGSEYR